MRQTPIQPQTSTPAFKYEIVERIAVLSQYGDTTKELNKVSYNGTPAKYDLRSWRRANGEEKLLKGLTLSEREFEELKKAIRQMDRKKPPLQPDTDGDPINALAQAGQLELEKVAADLEGADIPIESIFEVEEPEP